MKNQINTLINKHTNKLVYGISTLAVVAFWLLAFSLTSCNKDQQPDQRKPITIMVKTEGLLIKEMTKSFSLSDWQYNYNPNSYELTFTGTQGNNYTFNKTIQELKAGFSVSVLPDNYVITYQTLHAPMTNAPLDNVLDITINESKTISTPTDLTLQAHNDDFLIVMDNNCQGAYLNYNVNQWATFFNAPNAQTFKYAYYNQEGQVSIQFNNSLGLLEWITIPNAEKNNIYHVIKGVNGQSTVIMQDFNYSIIIN